MSLTSLLKGWIGEALGSVAHAVHLAKGTTGRGLANKA